MALSIPREPVLFTPNDDDALLAQESSRQLGQLLEKRNNKPVRVQLLDNGNVGPIVTLPAPALHLLLRILTEATHGNAVTLVPHHAELTTQQVADFLNVSRPYIVKLLEEGAIPFHKVGTHRRVQFSDVIAYKQHIDTAREKTLEKLAALSQELNLDKTNSQE